MSQDYEGWDVDPRPAVKGLALFLILLLALVVGTAFFYNHRYAPRTRPDPHPFPQPVLETIDSAPDDRNPVAPTQPPVGIDRAMAEVASDGNAVWNQ
jgi:hypothetical protein